MEPRLPDRMPVLTERQREVAQLVAAGLTNAEIGERLGISLDGAKYHVSEVLTRLNVERREQVAERIAAPPKRSRRGFAGLALAAGALTGAVIAVAAVSTDLIRQPSSPSGDAQAVSIPIAEPAPTDAASEQDDELSEQELASLLYRPVAWDHADYANRTPPPSLTQVQAERSIHAAGYAFSGTLPPVFGSDLVSDAACASLPAGIGRAHSGDWVLVASDRSSEDAELPVGRRSFTLYPSNPAVLTDLNYVEHPLRLRAVDQNGWLATHLTEVTAPPSSDDAGESAYHFTFESPRSADWLAVVTAGPLWGCFTFDVERDASNWPVSVADVTPGDFPSGPAGTPDAEKGLDAFLANLGGAGDSSRVCVDETSNRHARSGEIVYGATGFSPPRLIEYRHRATSFWIPRYVGNDGALDVRSVFATAGADQPIHTTRAIDPQAPGSFVSHDAADEVLIDSSAHATPLVLPRAGTWFVVATAAPTNWGCFVFDVADSPGIRAWGQPPAVAAPS